MTQKNKPTKELLEEYKDKTILITGGAGCIGSNLTWALLKAQPKKIIIIDDLSASFKWNIPNHEKVEFIKGSVLDEEILKQAFFQKPDYVFHFSALFANQNSIDHPESGLKVDGLGILKVLEHSRINKIKRFIFSSSGCSVYGSQAPLPLKEDFVSIHLDTPYMITKLLGELYCNFFHNHYFLPVVVPRFFNVYGPGEVPGKYRNVIPKFIYWAMQGKPLPILGTGEETRDYTYVGDVVRGLIRIGVIEDAIGQATNFASETETKIIDIANIINKLTGNKAGIVYKEKRDWDKIVRRRASIQKAKNIIGYKAETKMEDGIRETINWFKENWDKIKRDARF